MNELVVDACSFILWSEVSFLEIIIERKLFTIVLTEDVLNELEDEVSRFYVERGKERGVIKIVKVKEEEKNKIKVKYKLGKGEVAAIAFCMKEGKIFITDDKKAEKKAEKEKVKVFTTPQVIKEFVKDDALLSIIKEKIRKLYPNRFPEL